MPANAVLPISSSLSFQIDSRKNVIFRQFFQVCCAHCLKGQTMCSKYYDSPQGCFKGQTDGFPRVTGLFSIQSRPRALLHCPPCFYLFAALHDGQSQGSTRVKFKFVASVVIRAAKLEFVAESRTRVYFAQHVASTCNTVFCCETSRSQRGNTRNRGFQLAMQQCCPYYRTFSS